MEPIPLTFLDFNFELVEGKTRRIPSKIAVKYKPLRLSVSMTKTLIGSESSPITSHQTTGLSTSQTIIVKCAQYDTSVSLEEDMDLDLNITAPCEPSSAIIIDHSSNIKTESFSSKILQDRPSSRQCKPTPISYHLRYTIPGHDESFSIIYSIMYCAKHQFGAVLIVQKRNITLYIDKLEEMITRRPDKKLHYFIINSLKTWFIDVPCHKQINGRTLKVKGPKREKLSRIILKVSTF